MIIEPYGEVYLAKLKINGLYIDAIGGTHTLALNNCFRRYNEYVLDKLISKL